LELGPFDLELGGHIAQVTLAYRTWGTLNAEGTNAVIVLHALTGDSLASGPGGWWEPVAGTGRPIDTDNTFVICANVLGGCSGSTGPASINPDTGRPWAMTFPLVTIGDIVATQRRLVERLGVTSLIAIGGSIGGFQALEWATRHADLVRGTMAIAAGSALSALGIATHSELGRRAIMADPAWQNGEYHEARTFPTSGLAIARMAAMTTYHSRESLGSRFGRSTASRPVLYPAFGPTFDVEGYLHYHGEALVRRFDPNSYLYLTRAMDLYDVARDGGADHWLGQVAAPVQLVGISSDWLFTPGEIQTLRDHLAYLGRDVRYAEIDSPNGHDAFLKDWDQLNPLIESFIAHVKRDAPGGDMCTNHGSPP
jgi:homoserine O-acetyltransferase